MKTKAIYLLLAFLLIPIVAPSKLLAEQSNLALKPAEIGNKILERSIGIELGTVQRSRHEQLVSSGPVYTLLDTTGELNRRADAAKATFHAAFPSISSMRTQGCQNVFNSRTGVLNRRANQDCSLRRQAEEVIAINPLNSLNLIAGANDSRMGFNHCSYTWSFDGGLTWGDLTPPFYGVQLLDGHTADACSDPTATFDSNGNAYIGGILFDISAPASAIVVAKSNSPIGGAFYHAPDSSLPFQTFRTSPLGVVANDNDPNIFNDKEFVIADSNAASPKKNNVYAAWVRFNSATGQGVGSNSPIFFSQSTDGGATWSAGIEISGSSAAACTASSGEANANACDQDQGPHPIVGPDGTIYVAFGNGNTPALGVNQHMIVSCPSAADCSNAANWTAPLKISDDIGKQPFGPSAATGCPAGRQCLPPNGYRLEDFVEGSLSVDRNGKLYFVWADFRNGVGGSCDWNGGVNGQAAVATPPCDNDVFYVFSLDGGASWSAAFNVTPASKFGPSAQWQPWSAVSPDGTKLWIAYYDRSFGACEITGCNDISVARITNPGSASPSLAYKRITTSSMPNLIPANNPLEAGFLGDYIWVAVSNSGLPHVVWADTRGLQGTVEEDIYFWKPLLPTLF